MRKFISLTSIILFCASGIIIGKIPSLFLEQFFVLDVIYNQTQNAVPIYSAASDGSSIIGRLESEKHIEFEHRGDSDQSFYGKRDGHLVRVGGKGIKHTNLILGHPVSDELAGEIYQYSLYAVVISAFLLIMKGDGRRLKLANQELLSHKAIYADLQSSYQTLSDEKDRVAFELKKSEIKIADQDNRLQQIKLSWDKSLKKAAEEESKVRKKEVELTDLQDSLDRLDSRFKTVIEEAKVFDFPYKNDNYQNILKGRKFELRVAKSFAQIGCKILEWTPDKGFENNIYVESNSNPDLVLKHRGHIFSVECKYRSDFFNLKIGNYIHDDEISWATDFSSKHYTKFSKTRHLDVYIAIGFQGDPESPDYEYLIPLGSAQTLSEDRKWESRKTNGNGVKKNHQKIVRESEISQFIIANGGYLSGVQH